MSALTSELEQALPHLDARTKAFVERVIREAIQLARGKESTTAQDTWAGVPLDSNGYPVGYREATFGSFANEPLVRAAQGDLESREEW